MISSLQNKSITLIATYTLLVCLLFIVSTGVAAASPATQSHPVDHPDQTHCNSNQHIVKIDSGHNAGKFYCADNPQAGVGVGNGVGGAQAHQCGGGPGAYVPSINIGCQGKGNPIADASFAIIRVLSDGVGLVIIGSIVVGGIQYSASRGDPQATAQAIGRIRSSLIALLIFIFAYAILNFIIPNGFLNQ